MASRKGLGTVAVMGRWVGRGTRRCFRATAVCREIFEVKDEEEFEKKVLKSSKPVVVDFFATWCGPCKVLTPVLEAAVKSKEGKIDLAKVDIDQLQELAINYQVSAVPTVAAVKDGELSDKLVGVQEPDVIEAFLDGLTQK